MISAEEARNLIRYEPETGRFFVRVRRSNLRPGDEIGCVFRGDGREYYCFRLLGRFYLAHRVAWLCAHGEWPPAGKHIDHINGDGLDNRLSNLRLASNAENSRNSRRSRANTTGLKGVSRASGGGKWRASIWLDGRAVSLGRYATPEEAHHAYVAAARAAFGEFARAA